MTTSRAIRGEKTEGVVQVLILLTIGTVAAAASFTHVHNVAAAHGQPGWLAWADAVTLELMSIATGLEIRRRARTHRKAGFVAAVLISAVALSLAAQVVEAEPSLIGWLAAALPALGFLACVKIVMGRTVVAHTTATPTVPAPKDAHGSRVRADIRPVATASPAAYPSEPTQPVSAHAGPVTPNALTPALPAALLDQAREVATEHRHRTGAPITSDELRSLLRISNATAADVMRALGLDSAARPLGNPLNGNPISPITSAH